MKTAVQALLLFQRPSNFSKPFQSLSNKKIMHRECTGMHGNAALIAALPPKLQRVVNAWPTLPPHIQKTILTPIQSIQP